MKTANKSNGEIPEGWEDQKLGELIETISETYQFDDQPVHFLNTSDIYDGKVINHVLSQVKTLPGQAKKSIKKNDFLFSEIRPANRRFASIDFDASNYVVSTKLMVLRCGPKIIPEYLKYFLTSENILTHLQMLAESRSGTFPQITFDQIADLEIQLPDKNEQHAIAKILSDLDEKIELNHRMNKTLESIAQAIFRRWFVGFNFPDENGRPYKDSGGRMIDTELGEIPAGWEVKNIEDVVIVKGGTTPSTKNPEFWEGGNFFWCTPKDLSQISSPVLLDTERKITEAGLQSIGSGLLKKGVLLLSSRAPIGYLAISEIPVSINQGFIAILCDKKVSNYFMYFWTQENLSQIKNMANGSTFQEINKANFRKIKIVVPTEALLQKFDAIVFGFWNSIINNEIQNKNLSQIRDSLLPKLMSGKIRVKDPKEPNGY